MIPSSLRGTPIRGQNHRIQIEAAMIRSRTNRHGTREAFLHAFDPLELDGHDLRDESWHVRPAAKLREPAKAQEPVSPSDPAQIKHLGHVIAKVGA